MLLKSGTQAQHKGSSFGPHKMLMTKNTQKQKKKQKQKTKNKIIKPVKKTKN